MSIKKINQDQLKFDGRRADFFHSTILPALEKNGVWSGMLDKQEYHRMPGISSTKLRDFMADPYTVEFYKEHPELREDDKPCFKVGRLFHEAILEGAQYKSDKESVEALIAMGAKSPRLRKEYKQFKADCEARKLHVVKHDESVMLKLWKRAAQEEKKLNQIFENDSTVFEKSYFTLDPSTGLVIKFTADIINEKLGVIFDAKFVSGREDWTTEIKKYGYHVQAAFYLYCANICFPKKNYELFPFVHYCKKPPYKISFKMVNDEDMAEATDAIPEALKGMAKGYKTGKWGSILETEIEFSRPLKDWQKIYTGGDDE